MIERAESIRVMHPLFQAEQDGSTPISALSAKDLTIEGIAFNQAKALNRRWHSRLPRLAGEFDCICFAATHGGIIYAIAIWSHPIARMLPQHTWLELRRLAAAPDAPRNTCSRMLRIMELMIRRTMPEITTLVSYQDTEVHTGGIYRASGWKVDRKGQERDCRWETHPSPGRPQSKAIKYRWVKIMIPDPPAAPSPS